MKTLWVDTETGGTDPKQYGLISLAYIVDVDGLEMESGTLFTNCEGKFCSPEALAVNRFTVEQIKGFPPPIEMYRELKKILTKYVNQYDKNREGKFYFGAYNARFDWGFLSQLWEDCNDRYLMSFFNFGHLDPAVLARFVQYSGQFFPAQLKLGDLAGVLGIEPEGELHDALTDIRLTRKIAQKLVKMWIRGRARTDNPQNTSPIVF